MTLARVSVLRGEGSKTGVPFIDDHIQTFEPIADYLTEFSGIRRMFNFFCPFCSRKLIQKLRTFFLCQ
jgi:hypothetical protein